MTLQARSKTIKLHIIAACLILAMPGQVMCGEIKIAVASNFAETIKEITKRFTEDTGHKVVISVGSTGKHYAQIKNGAPFHAFFAADTKRPKLLDYEGLIQPGSRFTYAIGKIVLWSPEPGYVDQGASILEQGKFQHMAIANPKLAPYGRAAQEVLTKKGLWGKLRRRMVRGENIGQTYQFVKSGNAKLGFVAWSQVKRPNQEISGSLWVVPQSMYSPIRQQAVLVKDNRIAREFLKFVRSSWSLDLIRSYGYGVADAK